MVLATSVNGSRRPPSEAHTQEGNAPLPPGFHVDPKEAVEPQVPVKEEKDEKEGGSSALSNSKDTVRPHPPGAPFRPHGGPRTGEHTVTDQHDHPGQHHTHHRPHFIRFGLHGVPIYSRHRHRHSRHHHHHHKHDHKHGHSSTQVPASPEPIESVGKKSHNICLKFTISVFGQDWYRFFVFP